MTDVVIQIGNKGSMKTGSAVDQVLERYNDGIEVFANIHIVGINCDAIKYNITLSPKGNKIRIAEYVNTDLDHFLSSPQQIIDMQFPENSILFTDEIHTWMRNRKAMTKGNIALGDFGFEVRHFDIETWLCTTPVGRSADIDLRDIVDYWVYCEPTAFRKDEYGRENTVEARLIPIKENGIFGLQFLEPVMFDEYYFNKIKDLYNTKEIVGIPTSNEPNANIENMTEAQVIQQLSRGRILH